ncbi:vitronectin-like isoform X1 [Leucoraja erinacea]|uniref:vitronectin-like isoform X1 n=1 Tax=Leucoraja erinaceus TaxID=7782 RepID=UPI0024566509|nr:vitronectin-like isoform X1 [Leucoraja erinacea]
MLPHAQGAGSRGHERRSLVSVGESCAGRCDVGFQPMVKCQCDAVCAFYSTCCRDYYTVCVKTRGDVFAIPEEDVDDIDTHDSDFQTNVTDEVYSDMNPRLQPDVEQEPTHEPEPTYEPQPTHEQEPTQEWSTELVPTHNPVSGNVCLSVKPFDAFTDLKNGSIFAFKGQYFYELDKKGVVAGYPKQILDVWGLQGPIDAAFTRINCEGLTYLFKGKMYWRFDDGILEYGFPKQIKDYFPNIPTDLDAALAIPASGIRGKERVYFFKGNHYWLYVFKQQPTQEECARIPISIPFLRYTDYMADKWEDFSKRFRFILKAGANGPFSIGRHWRGIPNGVDAVMIGKLQMVPKQKQKGRGRGRGRGKHHKKRWPKDWHRKDSSSEEDDSNNFRPHYSVYFFVGDKYYLVDLASKWVDISGPRSITKYWFKCEVE